jgi:hypothetical protein
MMLARRPVSHSKQNPLYLFGISSRQLSTRIWGAVNSRNRFRTHVSGSVDIAVRIIVQLFAGLIT